jgi:hypothetical protein
MKRCGVEAAVYGVVVDVGTAVDFPSLTGVPLDRTREVDGVWRRSTS